MNKLPHHIALKEWASVIEALGRGAQIILLRKGGLADASFGIEADRFYLFPTNYHDAGGSEPSHVPIRHWAEVVRTWQVTDGELLHRLAPMTVLDSATLATRYRFRPDQAINVIAVRAWRLPDEARIAMKPEYAGCRSWVSIDDEIDVTGSTAALADADLQQRVAELDALLHEQFARR
jgi:hypothetical protein